MDCSGEGSESKTTELWKSVQIAMGTYLVRAVVSGQYRNIDVLMKCKMKDVAYFFEAGSDALDEDFPWALFRMHIISHSENGKIAGWRISPAML